MIAMRLFGSVECGLVRPTWTQPSSAYASSTGLFSPT